MDVKEAVVTAKQYVADLFADEGVANLGLEEVEYDSADDIWNITVGFSRPQTVSLGALSALVAVGIEKPLGPRMYKTVRVNSRNKSVISVKNREPAQQ
jgi:hypothetical protein